MNTKQAKRYSVDCRDWQTTTLALGAEAAGILLYLLTMMRSMQASELSIRINELAGTLKISEEAAQSALNRIEAGGYLAGSVDDSGVITLRSEAEEKKQLDARRKRAARLLHRTLGQSGGQSGYTFFDNHGQSADRPKEVYSEVAMFYHPGKGEPGRDESSYYFRKKNVKGNHTLFNQTAPESKKEKDPAPQKVKALTEHTAPAHTAAPVHETELPADDLEAEFIEQAGSWPNSLRKAIREQPREVREAFYLYVRTREQESGEHWSGDRVRIAWLAARRVPEERRAESILAAAMGNWKTIRDCGSGCYFEKETGRVVSLVRGTLEHRNQPGNTAAELAASLARSMRRD